MDPNCIYLGLLEFPFCFYTYSELRLQRYPSPSLFSSVWFLFSSKAPSPPKTKYFSPFFYIYKHRSLTLQSCCLIASACLVSLHFPPSTALFRNNASVCKAEISGGPYGELSCNSHCVSPLHSYAQIFLKGKLEKASSEVRQK